WERVPLHANHPGQRRSWQRRGQFHHPLDDGCRCVVGNLRTADEGQHSGSRPLARREDRRVLSGRRAPTLLPFLWPRLSFLRARAGRCAMNENSVRLGAPILGVFAVLMLLAWPCKSRDVENGSQRVLLEIGQEKITVEDFFLYLRQINPRMDFAKLPTSDQRQWLDEFVAKKLFAKRARESKLDQVPEVRARIEFFTDSVLAQEFK